jgi:hypothetical protein
VVSVIKTSGIERISLVAGSLAVPFLGWSVLAFATLIWIASLAMFLPFPLYEHRLRRKETNVGFVFFDFGRTGLPILMWLLCLAGLAVLGAITGDLSSAFMLRWGITSLGVLLILSLDLAGSTPSDALSFRSPTSERIGPDVVRHFKLNLLGKRGVASTRGFIQEERR